MNVTRHIVNRNQGMNWKRLWRKWTKSVYEIRNGANFNETSEIIRKGIYQKLCFCFSLPLSMKVYIT